MYKETLDILMTDINRYPETKRQILKQQLVHHFTSKNDENCDILDNLAVIVRRILDDKSFNIPDIVGVQPTPFNDPTIISGTHKHDVYITAKNVGVGYPSDVPTKIQPEINQAISSEIQIEITSEILKTISDCASTVEANLPSYTYAQLNEPAEHLLNTIRSVSKEINANWLIVSPVILSILQSHENSKFETSSEKSPVGSMGSLLHVGQLDDMDVYVNMWIRNDNILLGYKDPDSQDAAIVYAPETMIVPGAKTNKPDDPEGLFKYTPLYTRYSIFKHVNNCKEQYRKIVVKGLDF